MLPLPRRRRSSRQIAGPAALALLLAAGSAQAVSLTLEIDPAQSRITPESGAPESLAGTITVELGDSPPLAATTSFALTDVTASASGGLEIRLDPDLANPGLGALNPAGSFLVPTLFLELDAGAGPFDQTVVNLTGTLLDGRLETLFEVDTLGPQGVLSVQVVAVPEPSVLLLTSLGALGLGLARRTRREEGR
ncbi:MAG: PEP-CTERM sorting domain-containing protein [Myxococcota bacterium]|nr:PEP-CTERM sorting domain-containing protein [Myxococcota bacterium]